MYVKYSMDDILHDDILLFSLFLFCVHFSSILKENNFVITRDQVKATTEKAKKKKKVFSLFFFLFEFGLRKFS